MGDYTNRKRTISAQEEALYMHKYWEEKYLIFMMTSIDGDKRSEKLIEKAESCSKYWLGMYNALMLIGQ